MTLYKHDFGGTTAVATRHQSGFWSDSVASLAAAQAAAVTWVNTFWAGFDDFTSATVTLDEVNTREIDQLTGRQLALATDSVALAGIGLGDMLPPDTSPVVSLRTPLANRRGRGRMYLPQLISTGTTDAVGRLEPLAQGAIATALESAWSGYSATGNPVVYSRIGRTFVPITTFDVPDLLGHQGGRIARVLINRDSRPMP